MPVFLINLHTIVHTLTGGLDCVILSVLLFPYLIYRVFIKRDLKLKEWIKKGYHCSCGLHHMHRHDHEKENKTSNKKTK